MTVRITKLEWDFDAWEDYLYWQTQDKKTLKKINDLIEDIRRNGPMKGAGKPEALKYASGYSRRIDKENRLVYEINDKQDIMIKSCKGHYEE